MNYFYVEAYDNYGDYAFIVPTKDEETAKRLVLEDMEDGHSSESLLENPKHIFRVSPQRVLCNHEVLMIKQPE